MFELNDIVYFTETPHRYGLVVEVSVGLRPCPLRGFTREPLYRVRYIDPNTGRLMPCPDPRCGGRQPSCPICSRSAYADQIHRFKLTDLAFYLNEGLIHESVLG